MWHRTAIRASEGRGLIPLLAFLLVGLWTLSLLDASLSREKFVTAEATFTDASTSGLEIVPASCATNPSLYHNDLTPTVDGGGYIIAPGQLARGVFRNGMYLCVSNLSGSNSYFIPANTAEEMTAFKDAADPNSELEAW